MLIDTVWQSQPGKYFCVSTKSRTGEWEDHFFTRRQFKSLKSFIEDHQDKDLYWCPHGFTKARRLKKFAEPPHLLYADLDEVDPRDIEDLMPSIAWESSPGRYVGLWIIDGLMTEDLNQNLTYSIGADKGGWDFTQVLRVPGTLNYKYVSTPKVRLMWRDGPVYEVSKLEKKLPPLPTGQTKTKNPAVKIYKKYEKNLSGFVRRELLKGKPKVGKRSEVLWRIINELVEAGMSADEIFEVIRISPWNKFTKRRDADEQLRREINKVIDKNFDSSQYTGEDDPDEEDTEDAEDDEDYVFLSRSMADVEEENINWIWYPYLAKGELTILEGDPGLGKSYLAQMIGKGIVDGDRLPSSKRTRIRNGKVAYFDMENSSGTVTKKRLTANGCNNLRAFYQEEEPFTMDDDDNVDLIYDALDKLKPNLVVFDTLNTYIGKADVFKSSESQQAFKRFLEIARRFNCSVLVLRHLTKGGKDRALYRGQGNIAFSGLARVVITVGQSPDDEQTRVMAVTKINVARPPKALTFRIEALPDKLKEQDRSIFIWGDFVDLTADEIIAPRTSVNKAERTEDAEKLIQDLLEDGPVEFSIIKRAAAARSIGIRTLYRARDDLKIETKEQRKGRVRTSYWCLPGTDDDARSTKRRKRRRKVRRGV